MTYTCHCCHNESTFTSKDGLCWSCYLHSIGLRTVEEMYGPGDHIFTGPMIPVPVS